MLRRSSFLPVPLLFLLLTGQVLAEVALEGTFVAGSACPATRSIGVGNNPGTVTTVPGRAYELLAGNREPPTHFLLRIPGAEPERRWVDAACGRRADARERAPMDRARGSRHRTSHVLAVSWQPAFCETRPDKPECASQSGDRFDADHFALHGLWPQPFSNIYCGVPAEIEAHDRAGRWHLLPDLALDVATRRELDVVVPGARSRLDRHEWFKHGTCHGGSEQDYFSWSLALVRQLNKSAVRDLFAGSIGRQLSASRIRRAFDAAFGTGAGKRVRISCVTDPSNGRRLISEITVALAGSPDERPELAEAIHAGPASGSAGCPAGIVDRAGPD